MQTATIAARDWWAQPREGRAAAWVATYQQSLQVRHRTVIADVVRRLGATSVLEIGCHCGPNLIRLAKEIPTLSCLGIDVNADAVNAGNQWAQAEGLSEQVRVAKSSFPQGVSGMADGRADVVLSCYALAYIAPPDLDAALYECGRLAKRAVILAEPMVFGGSAGGHTTFAGYQEWAHNYERTLTWVGTLRGWHSKAVRVTPPVDRLNAVLVLTRDACDATTN